MNAKKISIVLPNWNGYELLKNNLPAVIAATGDAEIVIADDASTDGSIAFIQSQYPQIKLVRNSQRRGFAANVNSGVSEAGGDIVVLLNTDVCPEKDFLSPLLSRFSDDNVFAVGCLEESRESSGKVLRGRGVARWEKGYFIHARGEVNDSHTAWVSGGSGAFRKTLWTKLGGMNSLYNPFYWEDIDLSYRALKAGYTIAFELKSKVVHRHESGTIMTTFTKEHIKKIVYRNQFIFIWKNLGSANIWISHIAWTPIRLLQALVVSDFAMIIGFYLALLMLPKIWQSRRIESKLWKKGDSQLPLGFENYVQ